MGILTRKSALEIVEDTRTILVHQGWCRLYSADDQGRVDLFHALLLADHSDSPYWQWVYEAILDYTDSESVTEWNDTHGRTANQVLQLLTDLKRHFEGEGS